ncbi:MAG: T9SS type A sorting domain-containing protein, partial [Flavobacteriaceae bacterium]
KFTVNGWNNQEQWTADGTPDCAENADDGTYENRALTVAGDDLTMPTVYWNLCVGEEPGNTYTVTFSVNTSAIVGGVGANGIYAGGGVLGNAQALQLTDDDGDGVWVGSIDLPEGTTGNYIFLNSPGDGGDWGSKENLEGQDCADPNNYNDRILPEVTADVTYLACFGECSGDGTGECPSDTVTYNLTMTVNTANITVGENGMYLGGGVFGGANAHAMSDDDGDGTWEVTVEVAEGTSGNYTFLNSPTSSSDWDAKENLEGQSCADPANYNDRILEAVNADTTLMHCFASCETDGSCPDGDPAMMLQGIIDFTVPEGGSDGKAIHLYVNEDISDLAQYGIGVANNGGGTDGQEYTFPTAAPTAGQHILVVRSVAAMDAYMNASSIFDHVFVDEGGSISQNGDDAIELYFLGGVVELFGDVDVDGTGEDWEYLDSWAYKVNGEWTYGGVNCTDGSTTTCDSGCPYPFADCTGDDLGAYLSAEGGWRYQYEVAGYRGVGPGDAMGADWWNSQAYEDFNNAAFPNDSGVNNGLVDDIMFFTTDGGFTFDTGEDGTIMGKKPEVDAAFDPDGTNAYDADNEYNEYWNYPLDDFTDTYTLGNDGTYDVIEFSTVGALGFYTSTGAQAYQILQQNNTTMYVRNVGSEGNSWYAMLTTDAHALSTSDNEILDMMVYPNPVDGNYVTILSPVQGSKEIQVFTVTGRRVMDTTINGNTLDVSSFNSGFYMLKVTINGQTKVSKLVVR